MNKKGKHSAYIDLGALEFRKLRKGSIEWCSTNHKGSKKNASHTAYILGIPTNFLCSQCKKEWVKIWKEVSPIEYV